MGDDILQMVVRVCVEQLKATRIYPDEAKNAELDITARRAKFKVR
jgi:hypothetical protein